MRVQINSFNRSIHWLQVKRENSQRHDSDRITSSDLNLIFGVRDHKCENAVQLPQKLLNGIVVQVERNDHFTVATRSKLVLSVELRANLAVIPNLSVHRQTTGVVLAEQRLSPV